MNKYCQIRTRFAPSPTGFLHIGSLRTALYSYLFAKQAEGQFVLRLEDTDIERYMEGATEAIYNGLRWAGLQYDEGPDIGGPYAPYIQSQRLETYKKYAYKLIEKGHAYYCFCDKETLGKMRQEQIAKKQAPKYDRRCLNLSKKAVAEKLAADDPRTIRMKIPEDRIIKFNDLVRGEISYGTNELDDQVLLKSDGFPTYHLAVVVDDHLMEISHVTRTEEWLSSTPKHILLYEYFDWETPQWAHLPLLLNTDKTKMSKRKGDVTMNDYIKKGYLPDALINYLAFLGWNPGTEKEIYSMQELIKDFSLERVHKAGAIFNIEKLNWYNQYYIKQLPSDELTKKCIPYLQDAGLIEEIPISSDKVESPQQSRDNFPGLASARPRADQFPNKFQILNSKKEINFEWLKKIVKLEQERMEHLSQIGESARFFFELPAYDKTLLGWKEMTNEEIKKSLANSKKIISNIKEKEFGADNLKSILLPEAELYRNKGELLWPLRVALSGQRSSPPPFDIAEILGKEKSIERIERAIKLFLPN